MTITGQALTGRPADSADYKTIIKKIKKLPERKRIALTKSLSKTQGDIVREALNRNRAAKIAIQNDIANLIQARILKKKKFKDLL